MKTLKYEHKPYSLTVMQVSLKDMDKIAEAMGAYRYTVDTRVGESTIINILVNYNTRSFEVQPGFFIGIQENGEALVFEDEDHLEKTYQKV